MNSEGKLSTYSQNLGIADNITFFNLKGGRVGDILFMAKLAMYSRGLGTLEKEREKCIPAAMRSVVLGDHFQVAKERPVPQTRGERWRASKLKRLRTSF